jgi:hypothetical protein
MDQQMKAVYALNGAYDGNAVHVDHRPSKRMKILQNL